VREYITRDLKNFRGDQVSKFARGLLSEFQKYAVELAFNLKVGEDFKSKQSKQPAHLAPHGRKASSLRNFGESAVSRVGASSHKEPSIRSFDPNFMNRQEKPAFRGSNEKDNDMVLNTLEKLFAERMIYLPNQLKLEPILILSTILKTVLKVYNI
jgi:hypothetical protein